MTIDRGSITYQRFVAIGDLDPERMQDAMVDHPFREIRPRSEEETSSGWVEWEAPLEEPAQLELWEVETQMRLKMRVDTLKVPATTMKAHFEDSVRAQKAKLSREKLTRAELEQLKFEVRRELRRRSLPKMSLVEAVWDTTSGIVRLATASRGLTVLFVELFENTFKLTLRPVGPFTLAWLKGWNEEQLELMNTTAPERFHLPECSGPGGSVSADSWGYHVAEWLTWLWCQADLKHGHAMLEGRPIAVSIASMMQLSDPGIGGDTVTLSSETPTLCEEGRTALQVGKKVSKARLLLDMGDQHFEVTLNSETWVFGAVQLPTVLGTEEAARLPERLALMSRLEHLVDGLFLKYAHKRVDAEAWPAEREAVHNWVLGRVAP